MPHNDIPDISTGPDPGTDAVMKKTRAVVDLHIARRNLLIYPASHEQVKRSIVRAFKSLKSIIHGNATMTLAVLKDRISIDGRDLGAKNSVVKDLAGVLKHYEIAAVTFKKGLKINDLAGFLYLICADRDKVMAQGGAAAVAGRRNFQSIQIHVVDYSRLQITDEQKIDRASGAVPQLGSAWRQFVSGVMTDRADEVQTARLLSDPGSLADMLNGRVLDADEVVGQYRTVLAAAEASESGRQKLAGELLSFQELIRKLDADLKAQFLSATFDTCGQDATVSNAAHFIDGLGGDLIVQMLHQANSQKRKISPTLLAFARKMGPQNAMDGNPVEAGTDPEGQQGFSSQNVKTLLDHEDYETYVDGGYGKLLDGLTRSKMPVQKDDQTRTLVRQIEADLTPANVHAHVGRAIYRLMVQSEDIDGYRDWGRQLAYLLEDLVECGAYGYLTRLMLFMQQEKQNQDEQRAKLAGRVLDRFSDPQFVAKAIETVQISNQEADPEAIVFFMELGEPVVVEIFDGLDPYQTFNNPGVLTQILRGLASLTAREALERINDSNPDYVLRMVRIIRKMGTDENVGQIRKLIDHENLNVRMEVLAALLQHQNKWGGVHLRELLNDPAAEDFIHAIELAGRYRVGSAVPQLEAIAIQRGEIEFRQAAIHALGRIGDPRAVAQLFNMVRRRRLFVNDKNKQLIRVIFETLNGYPKDTVQDLLHYGLKHKDPAVRDVCKQMLRDGSDATVI
jgi:HEAT repeat protein